TPGLGRPETALGLLRCQVLGDRVRLPEGEAVVLEHGHLLVRIDRGEGRALLPALEEIDQDELERQLEVVCGGEDLDRIRRGRKDVELHRRFSFRPSIDRHVRVSTLTARSRGRPRVPRRWRTPPRGTRSRSRWPPPWYDNRRGRSRRPSPWIRRR